MICVTYMVLLMLADSGLLRSSALISHTTELAGCFMSPAADDEPSVIVLNIHMVY